jgi:hypothetical protein
MVDPLQALKAKKNKILQDAKKQVEAIDHDLQELARLQSLAEKHGLALVPKLETPVTAPPKAPTPAGAVDTGPAMQEEAPSRRAIRLSETMVRTAGKPLYLGQIYSELVRLGIKIGGKRPRNTLSAYLANSKHIESISKGLYWLRDVPLPITRTVAGNSTPSDDNGHARSAHARL